MAAWEMPDLISICADTGSTNAWSQPSFVWGQGFYDTAKDSTSITNPAQLLDVSDHYSPITLCGISRISFSHTTGSSLGREKMVFASRGSKIWHKRKRLRSWHLLTMQRESPTTKMWEIWSIQLRCLSKSFTANQTAGTQLGRGRQLFKDTDLSQKNKSVLT